MTMNLKFASYPLQKESWPDQGRHILAQYDEQTIIVYQAYNPAIGNFAVQNGYFGGEFRYTRMSWIKPNFFWMMYRSGWGTKSNQEITLAIRLYRDFFDTILNLAVPSSFDATQYPSRQEWQQAVKESQVRLQWDPDHAPNGDSLERRAIQLGMRGTMLKRYSREAIAEIIDLSEYVNEQRQYVETKNYQALTSPLEEIYVPSDPKIAMKLRLDSENHLH